MRLVFYHDYQALVSIGTKFEMILIVWLENTVQLHNLLLLALESGWSCMGEHIIKINDWHNDSHSIIQLAAADPVSASIYVQN